MDYQDISEDIFGDLPVAEPDTQTQPETQAQTQVFTYARQTDAVTGLPDMTPATPESIMAGKPYQKARLQKQVEGPPLQWVPHDLFLMLHNRMPYFPQEGITQAEYEYLLNAAATRQVILAIDPPPRRGQLPTLSEGAQRWSWNLAKGRFHFHEGKISKKEDCITINTDAANSPYITVAGGGARLSPLTYLLWIHGIINGREASLMGAKSNYNLGRGVKSAPVIHRKCHTKDCLNPAHLVIAVPQRMNPYLEVDYFNPGQLSLMPETELMPSNVTLWRA